MFTQYQSRIRKVVQTGFMVFCMASPMTHASDMYPSKPITFVVPFGAGNVVDLAARTFAKYMGDSLGQSLVVENKPGAGASIGTTLVARAKPDGYTMLIGTNVTHSINPQIMKTIRYDPIKDFESVALIGTNGNVLLVRSEFPADNFSDFIKYAKANPGKLNHSASVGSSAHLAAELLKQEVKGLDYTLIPKNSGALMELMGGHVDFIFTNIGTAMAQLQSGKVKVLAVTTKVRVPELPNVPTIAEQGVPGFEVVGWMGVFMPKGTPGAIVKRMNAEVNKAQKNPELRKIMEGTSVIQMETTPEQAANYVKDEYKRWGKVIREANIQID